MGVSCIYKTATRPQAPQDISSEAVGCTQVLATSLINFIIFKHKSQWLLLLANLQSLFGQ